jgi:hypothetical protein
MYATFTALARHCQDDTPHIQEFGLILYRKSLW